MGNLRLEIIFGPAFVVSSFLLHLSQLSHGVSNIFFSMSCFMFSDGCADPFTSSESVDDSIPNLNPFLSKSIDAVPPPPLSSDAVSFPSGTPSHEMFSGKRIFFCPSQHHICLLFVCCSLCFCLHCLLNVCFHYPIILNHS